MTDSANGGERTPAELAQRWIDTMRSVADQIQRQQQTFQQMIQESMNSYMQLLNAPPFSVPERSREGQQAAQQTFQQASQQWIQLVQQQQQTFQQQAQRWLELSQQQQQAFQQMVQQSLSAYMDLFRPRR